MRRSLKKVLVCCVCDGAHDNVVVWHTSSSVSAASCSHCWCAWSSFVSWVFYWPCLFRACTVLWACDAQCACTESITHISTWEQQRKKKNGSYLQTSWVSILLPCVLWCLFTKKHQATSSYGLTTLWCAHICCCCWVVQLAVTKNEKSWASF